MVQGRILGMFEKDTLLESWNAMYVDVGSDRSISWPSMPGYISAERTGGTGFKVVTRDVNEAESWCSASNVRIISRQKLELDDILSQLVEQERLRMQS
jgi:ABC-2 type transport system ATP-binding protein